MQRTDGAGHVDHMFVSEDPATSRPPTEFTPEWFNAVQEELAAFVEGSGQALDKGDNSQVLKAFGLLLQRHQSSSTSALGTPDSITAAFSPSIAALTNGMTLYVRAASANTTATPSFTPNDGTIAAARIVKGAGATLAAGDIAGAGHWIELQWDALLAAWVLQNPATGVGIIGRLIKVRIFSESGTYVPTAGTSRVRVRVQGGGGAGGGTGSTSAGVAAGSGGAAGAYAESWIAEDFSGVTVTVGTGGLGIAGAAGGFGGTSSFGALVSAPGGPGGALGGNMVPPGILGSTGNSPVAIGGSILNTSGARGGDAFLLSTSVFISGAGGPSVFGPGASGLANGNYNGVAGISCGSGGNGAAELPANPAQYTGGNGARGLVIVEEYS